MKHWQETSQIVGRIIEVAAAGRRAALATVVRIDGSAYRRAGAKLLVEECGATCGGVSGGCLEADVREIALGVMREGTPRLRHYETGSDDRTVWGLGLGCNGAVDIFVQPVTSAAGLDMARRLRALLAGDASFAVSTVVRGPSTALGRMLVAGDDLPAGSTGTPDLDRAIARRAEALLAAGESELHDIESGGAGIGSAGVFTEVHLPPPRLVLCGAGDDAMPLAVQASRIGYRVTVVDHRPRLPGPGTLSGRRPHRSRTRRRAGRAAARSAHPSGRNDALVRARPGVGQAPAADRCPLHRPPRPPRPTG